MRNILVVEDEPGIQALLIELLDRQGFSYQMANDGETALEMAAEQWPAVVLLDLTLPGELDGWQVWDGLLQRAALRPQQIVLFTAILDSQGEQRAQIRGAYALARKPIKPEELIAVLQRALETNESLGHPDR